MYTKEIALAGYNSHVLADVMSALLHEGAAVNAIVTNPERMMVGNDRLTVSHLDTVSKDTLRECFEGYGTVVLAFGDDMTDAADNEFTLKHYAEIVNAVRAAGATRLVVVGAYDSEAFYTGDLKRHDDIDWVFISTEGDYAHRAAAETLAPTRHHEIYA